MAQKIAFILTEADTGNEILRFEAKDNLSSETALLIGELYIREGKWKFRAVGQGYAGGLDSLARGFGVGLGDQSVAHYEDSEDPMDLQVPKTLVDLAARSFMKEPVDDEKTSLSKRKRRSTSDVMADRAEDIRAKMKPILIEINSALRHGANERATRLILDRILQEVLGYSISEINPEQNIQGRKADYVLSPAGVDTIVIEAKRVGLALREKQIYQATSYAAHDGITWALLTNVAVWRLYKITASEKIEANLVFTIDLQKGLSDDAAYYFALISRAGIQRKTQLERLWLTRKALSAESLVSAVLNDEVLVRIRNVIARENGIQLDLADVRAAVEQDILKLG